MKKILSLSLVFVLVLSAFVLASCKGTNDKDAQNTAPPHSAVSETAAPLFAEAVRTIHEREPMAYMFEHLPARLMEMSFEDTDK